MVFWIRKFAAILGFSTFFVLLIAGVAGSGDFSWETLAASFAHALVGAFLFWVAGIVIADILLKGVATDIESDRKNLIEGGLLQQVYTIREASSPGGAGMPFADAKAEQGRAGNPSKKRGGRHNGETE